MSKTICKKKEYADSPHPLYECKKCGARARKEEKVCKPRKLEVPK